jgi:hypothetical protein
LASPVATAMTSPSDLYEGQQAGPR